MNQLINLSGDYVTFDVGEKKDMKAPKMLFLHM